MKSSEMQLQKPQVKFYVEKPSAVDTEPLVPVFHLWIQHKVLDEMLIDVTEYGHVHQAPALLLVGHGSDYAIDFGEGRAGLLYSRKRGAPDDAGEAVLDAFRRALAACKKLEEETSLKERIVFRTDEALFRVNDRLRAPNTKETAEAVLPILKSALSKVYGKEPVALEAIGNGRELFTVRIKAPGAPGVAELLKRIA
jgi:hypothetical protein